MPNDSDMISYADCGSRIHVVEVKELHLPKELGFCVHTGRQYRFNVCFNLII